MIFREGFKVDCIDILFQGKSTGWPGIKYYYQIAFAKIFNEESEQTLMILQFSFIQNAYNKIY